MQLIEPTNAAVILSTEAACWAPYVTALAASHVVGCVTAVAGGVNPYTFAAQYLQKCGRKDPHVFANFELVGIKASSLQDSEASQFALRKGTASAVGVPVETVSVDLIEDISASLARGADPPSMIDNADAKMSAQAPRRSLRPPVVRQSSSIPSLLASAPYSERYVVFIC